MSVQKQKASFGGGGGGDRWEDNCYEIVAELLRLIGQGHTSCHIHVHVLYMYNVISWLAFFGGVGEWRRGQSVIINFCRF